MVIFGLLNKVSFQLVGISFTSHLIFDIYLKFPKVGLTGDNDIWDTKTISFMVSLIFHTA